MIICLDNDFKTKATQKQIENIKHRMAQFKAVVERLNRAGKQVKFALPNHAGFDFNDVLKRQGYIELSKQINQLIALKDYQKITDNYIENITKSIENNLQKSIDNKNNRTISFKEKSIIFTDHSSDHILKNNHDTHIKQVADGLLQKDKNYFTTQDRLKSQEIKRFKDTEILHDNPPIQPTKTIDNQKGFER